MKLKRVQPCKRKPDFLILEFEEGEILELHREVVEHHGLVEGLPLSVDHLAAIRVEDERIRCRLAAWRLIAHRPRSRRELEKALRQRRFPAPLVDSLLKDLEERGFLDDQAYALQVAREEALRKSGPRRIEARLRERGISRAAAAEATQEALKGGDPLEAALDVLTRWNRRSKPEDRRKRRLAAWQFLQRRGFEADTSRAAIDRVLGSAGDPGEEGE